MLWVSHAGVTSKGFDTHIDRHRSHQCWIEWIILVCLVVDFPGIFEGIKNRLHMHSINGVKLVIHYGDTRNFASHHSTWVTVPTQISKDFEPAIHSTSVETSIFTRRPRLFIHKWLHSYNNDFPFHVSMYNWRIKQNQFHRWNLKRRWKWKKNSSNAINQTEWRVSVLSWGIAKICAFQLSEYVSNVKLNCLCQRPTNESINIVEHSDTMFNEFRLECLWMHPKYIRLSNVTLLIAFSLIRKYIYGEIYKNVWWALLQTSNWKQYTYIINRIRSSSLFECE